MRRRFGRQFLVLSLICSAAAAFPQARFSETDLSAPDAGQRLVAAAASEKKMADAISLLELYAPRLGAGEGKRGAFAALARFRELGGAFSLAAEAWLSASAAEPGARDGRSLLEAARCLIAVGETERASTEIASILASAADSGTLSGARLLDAYAAAFRRDESAVSSLKAISSDDAYAADRTTVLFLLARLFGDGPSRDRLLKDFSASPEALVLSGSGAALAALPHWLIAADRAAVSVKAGPLHQRADEEKPPAASGGPAALQLGLFKEEKNARALVSRLSAKGFTATIAPRSVGGSAYYAVTVDPGKAVEETTMRLKDAGFESFPLF